jgi:hypothetical protein
VPSPTGETIQQLYDRCRLVLNSIIETLDSDPKAPATLLICTHAATFVGLCRVLDGTIPEHPDTEDYVPFTTCITSFERVRQGSPAEWICSKNGYCDFLSHGCQRGWWVYVKNYINIKVPYSDTLQEIHGSRIFRWPSDSSWSGCRIRFRRYCRATELSIPVTNYPDFYNSSIFAFWAP